MATTVQPPQDSSTQTKLKPLSALPLKHQRFIAEYLKHPDATKAALAAGYKPNNAGQQGWQLYKKLESYIVKQGELTIRPKLHAAEVIVDRLQQIADSDIADFMTWDPEKNEIKLKPPDEIPKHLRRCIKSISQHETQFAKYLKLELHSPVAALDKLAKYHNLFKRTVASKGLVVIIKRPAEKTVPKQPIDVTPPKANGNGHGPAKLPQITFIRPNGGKTASVNGSGTTNGSGSRVGQGGNGHA
jgi:hypothetical protein